MRAQDDKTSAIVDRMDDGLRVEELKRSRGRVYVRRPGSLREGWVDERRVSETPPKEQPTRDQARPSVNGLSTAAIIAALIAGSIAEYPSNCPCPYNHDRAGHACGKRSAYSRPGGYAPLCYAGDITPAMITDYRSKLAAQ